MIMILVASPCCPQKLWMIRNDFKLVCKFQPLHAHHLVLMYNLWFIELLVRLSIALILLRHTTHPCLPFQRLPDMINERNEKLKEEMLGEFVHFFWCPLLSLNSVPDLSYPMKMLSLITKLCP